ncbi:MAG: sulfatase family protein, partial [Parvibaculales bacterium]
MPMRYFLTLLVFLFVPASGGAADKPNIIIIFADDLGYGDIQSYNRESRVPTPHLNRLAKAGVSFLDAHSASAVCTPSRYALLTGRYAWRTKLKKGVLWGYSPLLIDVKRATLASLLREQGYKTAAIGKWHLGMGRAEASFFGEVPVRKSKRLPLEPGPNQVGFDYFFGIPASLDMKPYLYVENGKPVVALDGRVVAASKSRLEGGGGFWRKGQIAEGFRHEEVLDVIAERVVGYIGEQSPVAQGGQPFFLYVPLTSPHKPWLPAKQFRGRSGAGFYGDFVAHTDEVVGRIMGALAEKGLLENSIVIFTSDNGARWSPQNIADTGHRANGIWRGQKWDVFDGSHRVPLIIRWDGVVKANSVSGQIMGLHDLVASIAALVGVDNPASDSVNMLPAIMRGEAVARKPLIHHSSRGEFAIRHGGWK